MTRATPSIFSAGLLATSVLATAFPAISFAGGEVGNGGDTVNCAPTVGSAYQGYYALDYLLTLEENDADIVPARSWEESRGRILGLLLAKYPDLARMLSDFLGHLPIDVAVDPDRRYLQSRIWEEAPFGLVDIKDQRIIHKLPSNCYTKDDSGNINILQTVIRQKQGNTTLYNYYPPAYRALRQENPLQFSYLMIHEWLWDFTNDVQLIRRVNRLLHSTKLDKLGTDELRVSLTNIGFSLKRVEATPVCERNPAVRAALEKTMELYCGDITGQVLDTHASELFLKGAEIATLNDGDFSGMSKLRVLDVSDNALGFLYEDLFGGMYSLNRLDISANQLSTLPAKLFNDTGNLGELKLAHNRLKTLPAGLFAHTPMINLVDLSFNELSSLPPGLLHGLHASVLLGHNPLSQQEIDRIKAENADNPYLRLQF